MAKKIKCVGVVGLWPLRSLREGEEGRPDAEAWRYTEAADAAMIARVHGFTVGKVYDVTLLGNTGAPGMRFGCYEFLNCNGHERAVTISQLTYSTQLGRQIKFEEVEE